jgi:hypothetical protein
MGQVPCLWQIKNVYKILIGKPEQKGPFERPRPRYGDIIKT